MAFKKRTSEASALEQYRVSLENVKTQPTISSTMTEYGYTPEVIGVGENLFANTLLVYNSNKTEDDETSAAKAVFKGKLNLLTNLYRGHRKKAKVVFRNDPVTLSLLAIDGSQPDSYVNRMEMMKKFYAEISNNEELRTKIIRLKVSEEEFSQASTLIVETETARAEYLREIGESEDMTKQKDAAFAELDDWMSEFYAVAKIALDDRPQLLEALGLSIRS